MIEQFVASRVCLSCKGCCRFMDAASIWNPCLLDEEINSNLFPASISKTGKIIAIYSKEEDIYFCPFLKEDKCGIYLKRPFECRLYPFLINREGTRFFLAVDLNCPFARDNYGTETFKTYINYLMGFLNGETGKAIIKNNPQLVQDYEGAVNIKEI